MMTVRQFADQAPAFPAATSWYLADVTQALGKQELFTKQTPQKLKESVREHALIEAAISSRTVSRASRWSPNALARLSSASL